MNSRKHFAGVILFFIIFGSTVVINRYLTAPLGTVTPPASVPAIPDQSISGAQRQQISYSVRLVSLDFNRKESYTTLALKREMGQSLPKTLWVRTSFFIPESDGKVTWSETVELRVHHFDSDRVEVTARSSCARCGLPDTPKTGYFARVFVSTEPINEAALPDSDINTDLRGAIPVLVQAERKAK